MPRRQLAEEAGLSPSFGLGPSPNHGLSPFNLLGSDGEAEPRLTSGGEAGAAVRLTSGQPQ